MNRAAWRAFALVLLACHLAIHAQGILACNALYQEPVLPLLTLRYPEEILQFFESFLGTFFLQEMPAIETAPGNG